MELSEAADEEISEAAGKGTDLEPTGNTMTAIVTSGVGYYGPQIRVLTNSEIAVIDLKW